MYHHLRGRLASVEAACAVVECGGVGFRVRTPLSTFEKLPQAGQECTLLTHLHVREDALDLYGFATEAERTVFRRLIAVSGVGPRAALAIMSHHSVAEIVDAVRHGDPAPLTRARGVGRKTAERVVLELRGGAAELEALVSGERETPARQAEAAAAQALLTLGYTEAEAQRAAREVVREKGELPLGELVREALKAVR